MALKKSDLYRSLWASCDELRGGMDASQYKDYILTLLFMKYVTDKAKADRNALIVVPAGGSFDDMLAVRGKADIGEQINIITRKLARANDLVNVLDQTDFNEDGKLGTGKEMVDRLTRLVSIFASLDFRRSKAEGDDLLGDAYEYLMRNFATESGKSKGQFYTPAEVSRVLAKVVGIGQDTRKSHTVYDPACGSGSLLLKAAAEAPNGMTIYGQERDNATWALAKMNVILHGNEDATIAKGNTITAPDFRAGLGLKAFDFAVMNPPFSDKAWSSGLENEYGRFDGYGRPPVKNGDYAFLLHMLKSLKPAGKGAVILPHGVLFRGNAEAGIRRELLKRGYIKGIIGLPANLFYGTGIPACIIVLDKENAAGRTGVFMIDASRGFTKDGNKNRLRPQDIHKIVDTFNRRIEIDRYSRMVPLAEIADARNDYNLNIPRYIDSSEPEDLQDLAAHLHGGIPDRDLDLLHPYWDAFPQLRGELFKPNRPGYSDLTLDVGPVQQAILDSVEFQKFAADARTLANEWFTAHRDALAGIHAETRPGDLIVGIADDLLARFKPVVLLDEYDVYEQLMEYWDDVMHDDVFLILSDGWLEAARPRKALDDKERKLTETPDLVTGSGRSAVKWKMDLIPPALIVARYFAADQAHVDELGILAEEASRAVEEFIEEHGGDDGPLAEAMDDGKLTKAMVASRLKEARQEAGQLTAGEPEEDDLAEVEALQQLMKLYDAEAAAKKAVKEAQSKLDLATLGQYGKLTEDEVKVLVLDDKWHATLTARIAGETESLMLALVGRVEELGGRYAATLEELGAALERIETKVSMHLTKLGVQ